MKLEAIVVAVILSILTSGSAFALTGDELLATCIAVNSGSRARLEVIVSDRDSAQKHVWRARIVLFTAAGVGTNEIMRTADVSKMAVWRWQERFMEEGVDGLLRDKTRPSRVPPLPASIGERAVALTLEEPPGETTHWLASVQAFRGSRQEVRASRPRLQGSEGSAVRVSPQA